MDLYLHYIIIFCDFQLFCGNALLLFWGGSMETDRIFVTKKEYCLFWEALIKAILFTLSESDMTKGEEMELDGRQ